MVKKVVKKWRKMSKFVSKLVKNDKKLVKTLIFSQNWSNSSTLWLEGRVGFHIHMPILDKRTKNRKKVKKWQIFGRENRFFVNPTENPYKNQIFWGSKNHQKWGYPKKSRMACIFGKSSKNRFLESAYRLSSLRRRGDIGSKITSAGVVDPPGVVWTTKKSSIFSIQRRRLGWKFLKRHFFVRYVQLVIFHCKNGVFLLIIDQKTRFFLTFCHFWLNFD